MRILICDPDDDFSDTLALTFRADGHETVRARTFPEAFQAEADVCLLNLDLGPDSPPAVTLDNLPVLVTRLPVIVLTASEPGHHAILAMRRGASSFTQRDEFISRGWQIDWIIRRMGQAIETRCHGAWTRCEQATTEILRAEMQSFRADIRQGFTHLEKGQETFAAEHARQGLELERIKVKVDTIAEENVRVRADGFARIQKLEITTAKIETRMAETSRRKGDERDTRRHAEGIRWSRRQFWAGAVGLLVALVALWVAWLELKE